MADLSIHVLNAGVGESVVIGLPNRKWGVIDCYASNLADPSSNPTMNFLRSQGVTELEFLCLTHPHWDHYRGLSHLLRSFKIRYFWRFGGFSRHDLKRVFLRFLKVSARASEDRDLVEDADELTVSLSLAMRMKAKGEISDLFLLSDVKPLYPLPIGVDKDLEIKSIAPWSNNIERYQQDLAKCLDEHGRLVGKLDRQRHNDVSAAVSIRFGKARVILCGDVEVKNWIDTEARLQRGELGAKAVKVSHHGSTTGYTPTLWAQFAAAQKPYAVVTPFRRFGLPKKEALEHIKANTTVLMTTCRNATLDGEAHNFHFSRPRGLRTQAFLRGRFKGWIDSEPPKNIGICSMVFKKDGSCAHSCSGDACEMT